MVSNHGKGSWSSNTNEVGVVKAASFLPCCSTHSFHSQSCKHTADFTELTEKVKSSLSQKVAGLSHKAVLQRLN